MKIITISREFGSGGRELGKRLADCLQFSYYDKEIILAVAENIGLNEAYVEEIMEKGQFCNYPITIGRSFSYPAYLQQNTTNLLVVRQKIIKALAAQGDCVIVGQSADVVLQEFSPFNLFVYADSDSKIKRCRERSPEGECLTDKDLLKKMKQVDAARAKSRTMLSGLKWGKKESYHLCVNTTGVQIKTLAPHIADYAKYRLGIQEI